MSDENKQVEKKKLSIKEMIGDPRTKERFQEMLGDNAQSFLMSVLNCVQNNDKLAKCEPQSVLMASAVAGTLGLPIDPNLGQAYIIPYNLSIKNANGGWDKVMKAQFQIGYKGLIQLGHRSQQFKSMNSVEVREGEFKGIDRMTGETDFDWIQDNDQREKLPVIGFVAYFKLTNGFEKSLYMTTNQMNAHGLKYSKSFGHSTGQWKTNYEGMGKKTVLKLLIDKFAPKSVEMNKAIKTDQSILGDYEGNRLAYPDNDSNKVIDLDEQNALEAKKRLHNHINISKGLEMLEQCEEYIVDAEDQKLFDEKKKSLTKTKK